MKINRSLALILAFALLLALIPTTAFADDNAILLGDLNDDGKISNEDLVTLGKIVINLDVNIPDENRAAGDVNGDMRISNSDVVELSQYLVGYTYNSDLYFRAAAVSQARSWLGLNSLDGSHKPIIDIYNSHKPLARGVKMQYDYSWCAAYVSAVGIVCGYTKIMPTECSCSCLITEYKKINSWVEDDSYIPSPGDLIFYDWDDSGIGDNKGAPDHIGMVEKVYDNIITVIEGNKDDSCARREVEVNGQYIRGYAVPKYTTYAQIGTHSVAKGIIK